MVRFWQLLALSASVLWICRFRKRTVLAGAAAEWRLEVARFCNNQSMYGDSDDKKMRVSHLISRLGAAAEPHAWRGPCPEVRQRTGKARPMANCQLPCSLIHIALRRAAAVGT